jgi:hypothetical protein
VALPRGQPEVQHGVVGGVARGGRLGGAAAAAARAALRRSDDDRPWRARINGFAVDGPSWSPPLLPARPMMVASMMTYSRSGAAATASNGRCHTPLADRRAKRRRVLFQRPSSPGRSRHDRRRRSSDPAETGAARGSRGTRRSARSTAPRRRAAGCPGRSPTPRSTALRAQAARHGPLAESRLKPHPSPDRNPYGPQDLGLGSRRRAIRSQGSSRKTRARDRRCGGRVSRGTSVPSGPFACTGTAELSTALDQSIDDEGVRRCTKPRATPGAAGILSRGGGGATPCHATRVHRGRRQVPRPGRAPRDCTATAVRRAGGAHDGRRLIRASRG